MLQMIREVKEVKGFLVEKGRFQNPEFMKLKKPFSRVLIEDTESETKVKIHKSGNEYFLIYEEGAEFYLGATALLTKLQKMGISGSDLAWLCEELI